MNRFSYAGGPGTRLTPNAAEIGAAREVHLPPTGEQVQHQMMARGNPELAAYVHAGDMPMRQSNAVWSAGGSADAQAYAARRNELFARQEQERQAVARQQQLEHENFARQPTYDHAAFENMEQQHWQQTSRMVQQHQQQARQFFSAPPARGAPPPRR